MEEGTLPAAPSKRAPRMRGFGQRLDSCARHCGTIVACRIGSFGPGAGAGACTECGQRQQPHERPVVRRKSGRCRSRHLQRRRQAELHHGASWRQLSAAVLQQSRKLCPVGAAGDPGRAYPALRYRGDRHPGVGVGRHDPLHHRCAGRIARHQDRRRDRAARAHGQPGRSHRRHGG